MKRVLLMNFGSLGDLHPFIGMGLALQKSGYDVSLGTNASHLPRVAQAGLSAIAIGPDLRAEDPELLRVVMNARRGPEILHRKYIFPSSERAIADALPHARKADLLITGMLGYFVPTLAELAKVPWALGLLAPIGYWSTYDPPLTPALPFLRAFRFLGPTVMGHVYRALFSVSNGWSEPLQEARKRHGLARQSNPLLASTMTNCDLNLALFSKYFAAPQPDWPVNLVQPGYIAYDGPGADGELDPELARFANAGEAPLLVTLGSTNVLTPGEIFEIAYQAIRNTHRRAIFLVGTQNLEEARRRYAGDQFGVFGYAPYGKLMPLCSVAIHQGGAGTTGQALRAGRPAVIIGSANDQVDNARHVQEIGAGLLLPLRKLSVRSLADAIDFVCRSSPLKAADEIGARIRTENPELAVVDAVRRTIGN